MHVNSVPFTTIFPSSKKVPLTLPQGQYDSSPEDAKLRAMIPPEIPHYNLPKEYAQPLFLILHFRDNGLITGPTGVGKSILVKQLAHKCSLPLTRVNLTGEISVPELIGFYGIPNPKDPDHDGYYWGVLPRAIQRPGILLLDEYDTVRPDVAMCMQAMLEDDGPGIFIPERDEFIPKHPDCIIIATANTRGVGDDSGLYVGTQQQNFAQLNRFHMIVDFPPLAPEKVEMILKFYAIDEKLVATLVKFYGMVLDAYKESKVEAPLSIRSLVHLAKYYPIIKGSALKFVIFNKAANDADQKIYAEMAQLAGL